MSMDHAQTMYREACERAEDARRRFEHPATSTLARRAAADDLQFWQGRKAHLGVLIEQRAQMLERRADSGRCAAPELQSFPRAEPVGQPSTCQQNCGAPATVYAIDPVPNGWGGRYCQPCADALGFRVVDAL
jgi:hypothetical protein